MAKFTKDDVEMALILGKERTLGFYKTGTTYQMREHVCITDGNTSVIAPKTNRSLVTNDEMLDILRGLSEEEDATVELLFNEFSKRLVIYDKGRSYGIETHFDKKWKFSWDDFLKNGFDFPN